MCPKFGNNVWHLHSIVKGKLWVLQMLGCKYQHPLLLAMLGRGRLKGVGIKTFWKTTYSSIFHFSPLFFKEGLHYTFNLRDTHLAFLPEAQGSTQTISSYNYSHNSNWPQFTQCVESGSS